VTELTGSAVNMNDSIFRVIDANRNRANEGLRVSEEIARFVLDAGQETGEFKNLRHLVNRLIDGLGIKPEFLISERDSVSDVGTENIKSESGRSNYRQLLRANMGRVEQSLRVFEEFSKLLKKKSSAEKFKGCRFLAYTLEKRIYGLLCRQSRTEKIDWSLYVIIDVDFLWGRSVMEAAGQVISGGATVIQLRAKRLESGIFLELALKLQRMAKNSGIAFIVNDRPDIARLSGAAGVHLGQADLPVESARKTLSQFQLIGHSSKNLRELSKSAVMPVDYAGFGPVFPTQNYPDAPCGIEALRKARRIFARPLIAIGGINESNAKSVLKTGVDGIAVISAVLGKPGIAGATRELSRLVKRIKK